MLEISKPAFVKKIQKKVLDASRGLLEIGEECPLAGLALGTGFILPEWFALETLYNLPPTGGQRLALWTVYTLGTGAVILSYLGAVNGIIQNISVKKD